MQEQKGRCNAKSKYSPAIVRAVLYDVGTSSQTLAQIAAKNGLPKGSGSMISKWVKKYSSDFAAMEDLQPIANTTIQVLRHYFLSSTPT